MDPAARRRAAAAKLAVIWAQREALGDPLWTVGATRGYQSTQGDDTTIGITAPGVVLTYTLEGVPPEEDV